MVGKATEQAALIINGQKFSDWETVMARNGSRATGTHILTLVLMAANVLALAAKPSSASTPYDVMELTVLFVVLPALVGLVGVASRLAWGPGLSALALAAQAVLFAIHLRREWGHLHGGEWILVAWIALAAAALLLVLCHAGQSMSEPTHPRGR